MPTSKELLEDECEHVLGISVFVSKEAGLGPIIGKWVVLWRTSQRLTHDGNYVGTAINAHVLAVRDGEVLSDETVRLTRWRKQRPRLFARQRLYIAKRRAARLLQS